MLTMKIKKRLVRILRRCDSKDQVEGSFIRFRVSDYPLKIEYLTQAMGNPELFFTDGSKDIECRYITVLSMFLTAEWKTDEVYERRVLIGKHRI
jgi:hypothetical protein